MIFVLLRPHRRLGLDVKGCGELSAFRLSYPRLPCASPEATPGAQAVRQAGCSTTHSFLAHRWKQSQETTLLRFWFAKAVLLYVVMYQICRQSERLLRPRCRLHDAEQRVNFGAAGRKEQLLCSRLSMYITFDAVLPARVPRLLSTVVTCRLRACTSSGARCCV